MPEIVKALWADHKLVNKILEGLEMDYSYLDGQTKDRAEAVSRFQNDESCNVFLVSLKAGEVRGCRGCHESQAKSPLAAGGIPDALRKPAELPAPPLCANRTPTRHAPGAASGFSNIA